MRRKLFFITIDEGLHGTVSGGQVHKTTAWGFDQGEAMDRALASFGLEYHNVDFVVATPVAEAA